MQVVCFYKWKQMVPWQRSHSHLVKNDDKRRNKQNLSKKINVDSQRFPSYNEKQALTPCISALLNGRQHSTSLCSPRTFLQVRKTPFPGAAWPIHPQSGHLLSHEEPCQSQEVGPWAWGGTHKHIQVPQPCSSPGTPAQFKMHPLPPAPWGFRTFLQSEALDHKMFRTHHATFPWER